MKLTQSLTHRRTHLSFLAGALLLATVTAACSGGAQSGAALTKEEYVAQGNAICTAGNAKMDAAMPDFAAGVPAQPTAEAFYNAVTTSVTTMIDELRALKPPAELQADHTAMIAAADEALVKVKADGLDAFMNQDTDPFAAANEIAMKNGLTVCAQSD